MYKRQVEDFVDGYCGQEADRKEEDVKKRGTKSNKRAKLPLAVRTVTVRDADRLVRRVLELAAEHYLVRPSVLRDGLDNVDLTRLSILRDGLDDRDYSNG